MDRVAVLLSTYNGECYIREQLDSIINQKSVDVEIIIRDDGSNNSTRKILSEYSESYDNITVYYEDNIGVTKSFLKLCEYVYSNFDEFDGYAFCDQDDYWKSGKLISSLNLLNGSSRVIPTLVVSNYYITDDNLNTISQSNITDKISIGNVMVESKVPGCVMHFNFALLSEYIKFAYHEKGKETYIHDHLLILVAMITGQVLVSSYMSMCYRQHSSNVIGATSGIRGRFVNYISYIRRVSSRRSFIDEAYLLEEILGCGDHPVINSSKLAGSHFFNRIRCVRSNTLFKNGLFSNVLFKIVVLIGLFKK